MVLCTEMRLAQQERSFRVDSETFVVFINKLDLSIVLYCIYEIKIVLMTNFTDLKLQ